MESLENKDIKTEVLEENPAENFKNAVTDFKEGVDQDITDVEVELSNAIDTLSADKLKTEIPNIVGKLREKFTGKAFKKVLTTLTAIVYLGAADMQATENVESADGLDSKKPVEVSTETLSGGDSLTYDATKDFEKDTEPKDPETNVDPALSNFSFRTSFDISDVELYDEKMDELKVEAKDFIENFSAEDLEKIKNGKIIVQIEAGCSKEPVRLIKTKIGDATNNHELSLLRAKTLQLTVEQALIELGIPNAIFSIKTPHVEGKELGVSEDGKRFGAINFIELTNENIAKHVDVIIVDRSGSMRDDAEAVENIVNSSDSSAKIVDLHIEKHQDRTLEYHFDSINDEVALAREGSTIMIISDEKDDFGTNKFDSWQEKQKAFIKGFKELREIARQKNITVIGKMVDRDNPENFVVYDYLENGLMLVRGTDDADSYKGLARYLDYTNNKKIDSDI